MDFKIEKTELSTNCDPAAVSIMAVAQQMPIPFYRIRIRQRDYLDTFFSVRRAEKEGMIIAPVEIVLDEKAAERQNWTMELVLRKNGVDRVFAQTTIPQNW